MRPPHQRGQAPGPRDRQPAEAEDPEHPHQQARGLGRRLPQVGAGCATALGRSSGHCSRRGGPHVVKLFREQSTALKNRCVFPDIVGNVSLEWFRRKSELLEVAPVEVCNFELFVAKYKIWESILILKSQIFLLIKLISFLLYISNNISISYGEVIYFKIFCHFPT